MILRFAILLGALFGLPGAPAPATAATEPQRLPCVPLTVDVDGLDYHDHIWWARDGYPVFVSRTEDSVLFTDLECLG